MIAMFRSVPRTLAGFAFAFLAFAGAAHAIDIQRVDSPRGIEAWLVEDHSVPLVAMSFAFRGGASQDPDGKPGVANMLSGLLDEGAGDLDSAAFQARLDALSIGLSFDAGRDTFEGSLVTLAENRAEATRLLHLALTAPRLDEEPVARIRDQILLQLKRSAQSPGRLAGEALMKATFPDHPYGRPVRGTEESVAAITVDDLQGFRLKTFTRDSVKVAIVGDIDAAAASGMLDAVFGDLPMKANLVGVPNVEPKIGGRIDIALGVPQANISFAGPGITRDDPDYIPAAVATYILGGASDSRLFQALREERGLVYSVGVGLDSMQHAGTVNGGTSTRADQSEEVISLMTEEIRRFAEEGPTAEELATAKQYLIGSYPLRFVTSGRIADQLLTLQLDGMPIDYVDHRNDLIAALTLDQVKAAAKRLFGSGDFTVVRVGPPQS
mgnify:CR=1 FL=1